MPALRDRPQDVEIIANHYLERFSKLNKKTTKGISTEALQMLQDYYWPGNVRELVNIIERGTILTRGTQLESVDLPEYIAECNKNGSPKNTLKTLAEIEKVHIQTAIARCRSMEEAARVLGIDPATLWRKRKKYHLE
jgi:NtrC-family two-component system response regulator AlgB